MTRHQLPPPDGTCYYDLKQMEEAERRRQAGIEQQIIDLFSQLSRSDQEQLLDTLIRRRRP